MRVISILDMAAAVATFCAMLILLLSWRRQRAGEKWIVLAVCLVTIVVNMANAWTWAAKTVVADHTEDWGDYIQILQPALWGMFFYVVVQSAQHRALAFSRQQMRAIVENMPVILHAYDSQGRILAWNRKAEEVTGYPKEDVINRGGMLERLFSDQEVREQILTECREQGGSYQHRVRPLLSKQQHQRQIAWYNISRDFPIEGWANWGIGLDITEQLAAQKELEHMATHDELTKLPNRTLLRDRLEHALTNAKRGGGKGALLLLDLDHFKMVNDTHGHPVGDQLLCQVSVRLSACLKATDTLARLGGDEFVVLLERIKSPEEAAMVAERILNTLTTQPFVVSGHEIRVRTSVGIAVFPDDSDSLDELLTNMDLALYAAKESGRSVYHFYSRKMHRKLRWQHRVSEELRNALVKDEFTMHYQPQISLGSGRVEGVEALLRWHGPDLATPEPNVFIPIAESMGLMPALGSWVIRAVYKQAALWQTLHPGLQVAINLSVIQLYQPMLVDDLVEAARELGVDPRGIEFEITESAVMRNLDSALTTMKRLTQHGFSISLDDFGTGYSSLSRLKRFPVSKLKIDQSFVQNLHSDVADAAIVRSVIHLGHSLGLKVVAEGVETREQREWLEREGCDYMQGFFLSRPLAPHLLEAYLRSKTE